MGCRQVSFNVFTHIPIDVINSIQSAYRTITHTPYPSCMRFCNSGNDCCPSNGQFLVINCSFFLRFYVINLFILISGVGGCWLIIGMICNTSRYYYHYRQLYYLNITSEWGRDIEYLTRLYIDYCWSTDVFDCLTFNMLALEEIPIPAKQS